MHSGGGGELLDRDVLRFTVSAHYGIADDYFRDSLDARYLVHHLEHHTLDHRAQPAGTCLAVQSLLGDGANGFVGERELDLFELEELLVLLDQRVPRLGEDVYEVIGAEGIHDGHHGQSTDELGNETELVEVCRSSLL